MGGQLMPVYRLHFLNRVGEHVAHTYPFKAGSDSEAIAFAGVWTEDAPLELWCEDVRVMRWDGPDSASVRDG